MTTFPVSTVSNQILQAIPVNELAQLESMVELVKLRRGKVLSQTHELSNYIYFPLTCIVSLRTVFSDGITVESGLIGAEGIVGACAVSSKVNSNREVAVQVPGLAYRMQTDDFRRTFKVNPVFNQIVQRYLFALIEQSSQIGACNCHHNVDARLARLLLMYSDRTEGGIFYLTHEGIAQMLGVHRPTISAKARELKVAGLVDYIRCGIKILNRTKLEAYACECYEVIKKIDNSYNLALKSVARETAITNKNKVRMQRNDSVKWFYHKIAESMETD